MGQKEGREKGKRRTERIWQIAEMTVLYAGTAGIVLVLNAVPGITFTSAAVLFVSAIVSAGLFQAKIWKKQWCIRGIAGILAVCALSGAACREELARQAEVFLRSLIGFPGRGDTDVTLFLMLLSVLLSVLFFVAEILARQHWLPYILVTVTMAGTPVLGIRTGMTPVVWGLIFQILFWTVHGVCRPKTRSGRQNSRSAEPEVTVRVSAVMGGLLAVSVCIALVITSVWGENLSAAAYSGEGIVSRSLRRISGSAENPAADGHISAGNNYRTGKTQMTATVMEEPGEALYLKGFTGGEYTGGNWEEADEEELFHEMAQILGWRNWESWIRGLLYSTYFTMNEVSSEYGAESQRTLFLRHTGGNDTSDYFSPYYSMWLRQDEYPQEGYGFRYYEQDDVAVSWENVPEDFATARDWYREVQEAYMEVIPEAYTDVPEELLPRLTELCRGRTFGSVDEVTTFILSVLENSASYTLTPGRAPLNEDITEYFLFENHKGYCVHFAAAATLMYRLCGVPARYASGYVLQPSDFAELEDGVWQADVTDESAHAWTEIFLEDYGWVPVEVTPSQDGSYHASYPGLDPEALRNLMASVQINTDAGEKRNGSSVRAAEEQLSEDSSSRSVPSESGRHQALLRGIAAVFCESLILLPAARWFYRDYKRKKLEQMNCRQIFSQMMRLLHRRGYMTGYEGTEKDFADRFAKELPCVRKRQAEKMTEIVSRAAYGKEMPERRDDKFVYEIYLQVNRWISENKGRIHGRNRKVHTR